MSASSANVLDRVIAYVAPGRARRRLADRLLLEMTEHRVRRYEASQSTRRTQGWRAPGSSANAEVGPGLHRLRNRARDLTRNSAWAGKALGVLENHVIGTGVRPAVQLEDKAAKKQVQDVFSGWSESNDCDQGGREDFAGLQVQAFRSVAESGESLVRRIVNPGDKIPLRLQVLEADHIDTDHDARLPDGGRIIQGIELGPDARRRAYWLHPEHPGDSHITSGSNAFRMSVRVPAEDVLHLYRADRPGQLRGVPWGSPALLRMRDFDEYIDAQLLRQKIAAMFVGFITDSDARSISAPAEGSTEADARVQVFEPGTWEINSPGKDITFSDPPGVEGFGEYVSWTLREIAAAFGITYESLANDLTGVNFSSGRMGWLEMSREVAKAQNRIMRVQFLDPVWRWWLASARLAGLIPTDQVPVRWSFPRREMIDPLKETMAQRMRIRSGLTSLFEELRAMGRDPEQVLQEIAEGNAVADRLQLVLDSDPRQAAQAAGDGGAGGDRADELAILLEVLDAREGRVAATAGASNGSG